MELWLFVLNYVIFTSLIVHLLVKETERKYAYSKVETPAILASLAFWFPYWLIVMSRLTLELSTIVALVFAITSIMILGLSSGSPHRRSLWFFYQTSWLLAILVSALNATIIDSGQTSYDTVQLLTNMGLVILAPIFLWSGFRRFGYRILAP